MAAVNHVTGDVQIHEMAYVGAAHVGAVADRDEGTSRQRGLGVEDASQSLYSFVRQLENA